jgi:cob(I)alamin adenosyltransferase
MNPIMMNHDPGITRKQKGLVIVNTGDGKGKTTAALGVILRAWGRGFRICVIQFIKPEGINTGEYIAASKLAIEWYRCGDGFTWVSKNKDESMNRARQGWQLAQEKIPRSIRFGRIIDSHPPASSELDRIPAKW